VRYLLNRYLIWYNTNSRHGGVGMNKTTPQDSIAEFILQTKAHPFTVDINETLILYTLVSSLKLCYNKYILEKGGIFVNGKNY